MIINIKLVKISLQLSVEGNPWLLWFCFLCSVIQKTCSTFSTNQIQNLKLIVIQSFAILCKNENLALGEDNFFLISLSFLITCLLDDLWLLIMRVKLHVNHLWEFKGWTTIHYLLNIMNLFLYHWVGKTF